MSVTTYTEYLKSSFLPLQHVGYPGGRTALDERGTQYSQRTVTPGYSESRPLTSADLSSRATDMSYASDTFEGDSYLTRESTSQLPGIESPTGGEVK